jgi:hypothetical protein
VITVQDIARDSGKSTDTVNLVAAALGIKPPRVGWPRVFTMRQRERMLRALAARKPGRPRGGRA